MPILNRAPNFFRFGLNPDLPPSSEDSARKREDRELRFQSASECALTSSGLKRDTDSGRRDGVTSSLGGKSGFKRTGELGARFRMASKMTAEGVATERQKTCGHFIEDDSKRKRSLRASRSLPRTCSGDM